MNEFYKKFNDIIASIPVEFVKECNDKADEYRKTRASLDCKFNKEGTCECERRLNRQTKCALDFYSKDDLAQSTKRIISITHSKKQNTGQIISNRKGCCGNCYRDLGYFNWTDIRPENLKKISTLFHKDVGFWMYGTGCALPVKLRSLVCTGYGCSFATIIKKEKGTLC